MLTHGHMVGSNSAVDFFDCKAEVNLSFVPPPVPAQSYAATQAGRRDFGVSPTCRLGGHGRPPNRNRGLWLSSMTLQVGQKWLFMKEVHSLGQKPIFGKFEGPGACQRPLFQLLGFPELVSPPPPPPRRICDERRQMDPARFNPPRPRRRFRANRRPGNAGNPSLGFVRYEPRETSESLNTLLFLVRNQHSRLLPGQHRPQSSAMVEYGLDETFPVVFPFKGSQHGYQGTASTLFLAAALFEVRNMSNMGITVGSISGTAGTAELQLDCGPSWFQA